jgi:hypothetical protein
LFDLAASDDLPLHPPADDPRAYERYWFGFASADGAVMAGLVVNVHPRLGTVDAVFSVSDGERAESVFAAAALASGSFTGALVAGPVSLSFDAPMECLRIAVDGAGFLVDMEFRAVAPPIAEDRVVRRRDDRVVQDRIRYVQLGTAAGSIESPLGSWTFSHERWRAGRDHSWGIWDAPVPGSPVAHGPSFFWLIGTFDDVAIQAVTHAEPDGTRYGEYGASVAVAGGSQSAVPAAEFDVSYAPGTRHLESASLSLGGSSVEARSLHAVLPRTVGYAHPSWVPGQAPIGVRTESWTLADLDLLARENHRALQFVRLTRGDGAAGWGFVDQSG